MTLTQPQQPEERSDAVAFTDMLVEEVRTGQETIEGLEELQATTVKLNQMVGKDPECDSYYGALTTALYILKQGGQQ